MTLARRVTRVHLLDVNVVIALLDQAHPHHEAADRWFGTPGLQWALSAFTEAGVLRFFTRPKTGDLSMQEVSAMLLDLQKQRRYRFQPVDADWHTLTKPFFHRLHGHNQVTDAYLLGVAIREGLILTTFDKALLHLSADHKENVLILPTD